MYNELFKQRFLDESTYTDQAKSSIAREFNSVSYYEEMLNKDISNFSKTEILNYYKLKDSVSLKSLIVINSYFITYTTFAIQNNYVLDGMNHYSEFTRDDLMKCVNLGKKQNMILTRSELYDLIEDPELNLVAREKFMLLAIYEGIVGQDFSDLIHIKEGDITTEKYPAKLVDYTKDACREYEYQVENGKGERTIHLDPTDPCAIKANIRKDSDLSNKDILKSRTVIKALAKIAKKSGVPFTSTSLFESGRIDYIANLKTDKDELYDIIIENMDSISRKYNMMRNVSAYITEFGDYFAK